MVNLGPLTNTWFFAIGMIMFQIWKILIFWVQIHNLPFLNMSFELVEELGKTTSLVVKLRDKSKMRGSNFMRVRVVVDTTQPCLVGRKLILPCGEEG